MRILMSRTFERNLDLYQQTNEKAYLKTYFERLEKFENLADLNTYKVLGFKKYTLSNHDKVYGLDLNIRSAERIIATFLHDHSSIQNSTLNKMAGDNELTIILHRVVIDHDQQSDEARHVGSVVNSIDLDSYIEKDRSFENALELKEVYSRVCGSKIVRLLTEDKNQIVSEFVDLQNSPMILEGIAGSGKTEVLKSILDQWHQNYPKDRILFVTASQNLVNDIETHLDIHSPNVQFHTLNSLINQFNDDHRTPLNQISLIEMLSTGTFTDFSLLSFIRTLIDKFGLMRVYAEIVGIILGKLNNAHQQLSLKEYLSFKSTDSISSDPKVRENLYRIAQHYSKYRSDTYFDSNNQCYELTKSLSKKEKYDLVLIDEVQDFTETQFYFLFNLVNEKNKLFITGDANQTINPTLFSIGNVTKLFSKKGIDWHKRGPLRSNFRNSSEVTQLINVLNELRNEKLTARKQEYAQNEIGNNPLSGKIYFYKGNLNELSKFKNFSNVIEITTDISKLDSKFSVHDVKGLEFENVIVENLISDYSTLLDQMFDKNYNKTDSMHYFFNLFYVAVSRSLKNIVLVEEKESRFVEFVEKKLDELKILHNVTKVEEIDIEADESLERIYENGKVHLGNEAHKIAQRNFEIIYRINPHYPQIKEYLELTRKIAANESHINIANYCENNGLYSSAARYYQKSNKKIKYCLMAFLDSDIDAFQRRLHEVGLDVLDLIQSNEIVEWQRQLIKYFLEDQLTEISELQTEFSKQIDNFLEEKNGKV